MAFHQLVVSAAPGDAVTQAAFELRSLLSKVGQSHIFARHIERSLVGNIRPMAQMSRGGSHPVTVDDVLVFHGSIGSPDVFEAIHSLPCRVVLVYHNVSPSLPFRAYDAAFAELLRTGRRDIARLRQRVSLALAPSQFNANELRNMGYRDVRVSPLVIDTKRLRGVEPHAVANGQLQSLEGPLLLYVGQLLPHKRPDLLLQAFHVLSTYLLPNAHLALVGASRLPAYRHHLHAFIRELNLPRLHLVGPVPEDVLAAYFRRADVFVTASDHEGFCVPLIEAMAFEVPVVARRTAAIAETVQGGGLCLDPADGASVMAEAIVEVLVNERLRDELVEQGQRRVAYFDADAARRAVLTNLLDVA